jgi:hypothetical protein
MFHFFLEQQICSLIHLLHTCFVGIHGVFGIQSKPNVSNTTKCFDGSYEGDKFKIPHMQNETLEREDRLPTSIPCDPSLLDEAEATIAAANN